MAISQEAKEVIDNYFKAGIKASLGQPEKFAWKLRYAKLLYRIKYRLPKDQLGDNKPVRGKSLHNSVYFTMTPAIRELETGQSKLHVLFMHGGAFMVRPNAMHWSFCRRLAEDLKCPVSLLAYPLAPAYHHKQTLEAVVDTYRQLISKPGVENVIVAGDSAGATLSLLLAQVLIGTDTKPPSLIVPMSPPLDLASELPRDKELESLDPLLPYNGRDFAFRTWIPKAEERTHFPPNALYGPMEGLCPVLLFAGEREILCGDSVLFAQKARQAGSVVELEVYRDMWHTFPITQGVPECEQAYQRILRAISGEEPLQNKDIYF